MYGSCQSAEWRSALGRRRKKVSECYEHLPDSRYQNVRTSWKAQAYGRVQHNASFENMLDFSYNFPNSFGPWAGGMAVNVSQLPELARLSFTNRSFRGAVVHAMADGEWGGVQFEVAAAKTLPSGNGALRFRRGGWQQARTASLRGMRGSGSRFYIEGSLELLDAEGEWHFDHEGNWLYVLPPGGGGAADPRLAGLVLTQTDALLRFEAAGGAERVSHIVVENLTLAHSSASFFAPHEALV